ncbi:MAG: hydrogenase iron-sulfur subunit [Candidatus Wukongarchaeota archaeon]|nr:FAD-dependent oxidoreductase [Candidatus Wukongarchaeota archaeon]
MEKDKRVGVFLCRCGGTIDDIVDIDRVKEEVKTPSVVSVIEHNFLCSDRGQSLIYKEIKEKDLESVVIAACAPHIHKYTFRACVEEAGLNPFLLEQINLREQCAWAHTDDKEGATKKAVSLVRGGILKVKNLLPLEREKLRVEKSVLVIGAGIAGVNVATTLGRQGYHVYLVEKEPFIGGSMVRLVKTFPEDECSMCAISPLMREVGQNPNIELLTLAEIIGIEGTIGSFEVAIKKDPRYVLEEVCMTCGDCMEICPQTVKDDWNFGVGERKAIFFPFSEVMPRAMFIDPKSCRNLNGEECRRCEETCKVGAINFDQKPEIIKIKAGAIIVATGHKEYDPSIKPQFGYGRYPDVLTLMQLARYLDVAGPTGGQLVRPSTGLLPKKIVFIQCVGSRDERPGGKKYCSKVCCMASLKYSNLIKQMYPKTEIVICYTDLITPGYYEEYYRSVQEKGIVMLRGRPAEVIEDKKTGKLLVRVEETFSSELLGLEADLVVLAAAIEPSEGTLEIAETAGLLVTEDGFIKEEHPKLHPVDTNIKGIFACGTAMGPMDITETVSRSLAVAGKAKALIDEKEVFLEPKWVTIDHEKCDPNECRYACIKECPYSALTVSDVDRKPVVEKMVCTGCGACIPVCPFNVIDLPALPDKALEEQIKGILETENGLKPKIIAFKEELMAYAASDLAGMKKVTYPANIHTIQVPSIARLKIEHIKMALEKGAGAIILCEGPKSGRENDPLLKIAEKRFREMIERLEKEGLDSSKIFFVKVFMQQYDLLVQAFRMITNEIITEY